MCLSVLPPCMFVYHMHAWCQKRLEEEVEFLGVGITYSCEPLCGSWELNPSSLQEQMFLTAEPSHQSLELIFI